MDNELDQVLSLVNRLGLQCSADDYRQFLRDIISELKVMLDAAQND